MKIQDKIKASFDKCAKIKFEGDSNDHPIIYLNILKNIGYYFAKVETLIENKNNKINELNQYVQRQNNYIVYLKRYINHLGRLLRRR
mgnify:CR=1 FL=1